MDDTHRIPEDAEIHETLVEKKLSNGMLAQVKLVKRPRWFEAMLFVNGLYKPGPPLPRPLEEPNATVSHWMGVRPKIGLSPTEVEVIVGEVNIHNFLHKCQIVDTWGQTAL
ncbi:MAG: hypothetical protein HXX11_03615 [Desulfuromonadales bacterium]|nr:hypothetical protein [Desulfuromonadales bacterium]